MRICKIESCNKIYHAKGYCHKHYDQSRRYEDITKIREYKRKKSPNENHGMSNTLEYQTWFAMKQRCYDKNQKHYPRYGGRGIKVCDKWKNSFLAFYEDMGPRPFLKAQIDRVDNNGDYEIGNCKWVTNEENCQHQGRTVLNMFTVRSIKRLYTLHKFTNDQLALIYKLPKGTVTNIIYGRSWKEA